VKKGIGGGGPQGGGKLGDWVADENNLIKEKWGILLK